jgi:glycosyltransferase involved in cell wall biosynthesis
MDLRILWIQWRDIKHPYSGGAEVYMHEISRRLAQRGVKVYAVTSWHPSLKREEVIDGYSVERVGSHDDFILHVPQILRRYSNKVDIIVEDTSKIPLMTPLLRPKTDMPVVAIVHHLNREIYFHEIPLTKSAIAYTLEMLMPSLYTHLPNTILVAVSESTRQELIKLRADPRKIFIVPNGANHYPCTPNKDPRPTIIYLSRNKTYKQPHHALLAFKKVLEKIPDARLIIAGKGTETLDRYVKKLGIEHAVEIYGEVDEKTKIELLGRSWVLLQTSMKEGFGIVVLEAAICRTPTVAYDVPGLKDSIKHMETGILVKPYEISDLVYALFILLKDKDLRDKLGNNAYRYAQLYNWNYVAENFLKVIRMMR